MRATVYFKYYLFVAFAKRGRSDLILANLGLWRGYLAKGLTTPVESPAEPGFAKVRVAPAPGSLSSVRSVTPTVRGPVSVDLKFADGEAKGTVTLPRGVSGAFVWKGRTVELVSGENRIDVK